jgi:hypothetical protein
MFVDLEMFSKFENFHNKIIFFNLPAFTKGINREDIISFAVALFILSFYLQFTLTDDNSNTVL